MRGMWQSRVLRPALAGYLAGLATAGIIAMVMADAPPDAETEAPAVSTRTPPAAVPAEGDKWNVPPEDKWNTPQHSEVPISAETQGKIAPLEARLAADPGDVLARKQLAVVLLRDRQLMLAYEHASELLKANPDDPDGLYVHGVVRLAMGHAPHAIELLDRVLARYPEHALALEARAEARRKIGDQSGAALTAAKAREAAGGGDSDVDQLLAAAKSGTLLEMMRGAGPAAPATAEDPSPPATDQDDGNGD